jgi:DNA polymerase-1
MTHFVMLDPTQTARLVLQIHDDLVFEIPDNQVAVLLRVIREEMENAMPLSVPMFVNIKTGKNWSQLT